MRKLSSAVLMVAALSVLFAMSCASSIPTQPSVSPDREITGNSYKHGPGPHPPAFQWDCQRFFDAEYVLTCPNGLELPATGTVRIDDADCSASESDVMVHFYLEFDDHRDCARTIPGTKEESNAGTVYSGERSKEHTVNKGNMEHSFQWYEEYELTLTPTPDNEGPATIEGLYHRYRYDHWIFPDGEELERERDWYITIDGVETEDPGD